MMALVGELSQFLQWPSNLWTSSAKDPNFKWKNPSQIWKTYILYTLKFRGILHNTFDTKKKVGPRKISRTFRIFTTSSPQSHRGETTPLRSWKWTQTSSNLDATFEMGRDWWIDVVCLVSWFMLGGQKKVAIKSHHPSFQWKVNVEIDTNSQKSWL